MSKNIIVTTIRYIFIEVLWDIVYFPFWWYTKGLSRVVTFCWHSAQNQITRRLALGLWLSSMFKPMYGDTTVEGRIISGAMRIVVLVWKLFQSVLLLIVLLLLVILWIILPAVIVYYMLYHFFNLPFIFFPTT